MQNLATRALSPRERCLLYVLFFLVMPVLGGMVEIRSAFMMRRMGDLDCFLRAGWAVRNNNGVELYTVTSDNDWHYNYPPLYAILMAPLADPPRGLDRTGYVPYGWSVFICFLISVVALLWGIHALASALEETDTIFSGQPRFCRRWWLLRVVPLLICFLPIAHTLMRGQVNTLILALLSFALAGWVRGRNFRAGAWLALAICIKVIPAYLLVYPLWKRDGRGLAGCCAGCLLGLVVLPLAVFGPQQTAVHYQTYAKVFLGPMFRINDDDSRKDEIVGVNATDSIGVKNALHNWMYPDARTRPDDLHAAAKIAYLLLGIGMTFLTLWPGRRRSVDAAPWVAATQFAGLIVLMTIFSPVSHSHYLMFCLPIVMCTLASVWRNQTTLQVPWRLLACFIIFDLTMAIAYLPGLEILKDRCAALFAALPLWAIPVAHLWGKPGARDSQGTEAPRIAA